SLAVVLAAAFAAMVLGLCVVLAAGFAGGLVDEALMRVVDSFQIVPAFLLALAFVSTICVSTPIVVLAIALVTRAGSAQVPTA
ncbi:ABC transporter permease, partial [Rhizobium johnstonii]